MPETASTAAGTNPATPFVQPTDRDRKAVCAIAIPGMVPEQYRDAIMAGEWDHWPPMQAVAASLSEPSPQSVAGGSVREVLPQHIGRLHLGEHSSDGDRLCSHGHAVPAGHPLYWPPQISQYDDSDPLCLDHAIEQAVDDNGYCEKCTGAAFTHVASAPQPASGSVREDTVAFVQEWMMSGDHKPTQWDRDFAAAIDARAATHAPGSGEVDAYRKALATRPQAERAALAALSTTPPQTSGDGAEAGAADARMYLIRKRGLYYRPNAQGYTASKHDAGRYTLAEAIDHSHPNGPDGPRDGIDYVLADSPDQGRDDPALGRESTLRPGFFEGDME